jgi:hypothetical protein
MDSPQLGDLLIRCANGRYVIVDAISGVEIEGPFDRIEYAIGMAQSLAVKRGGSVWRENTDERGASFGPPQLITTRQY